MLLRCRTLNAVAMTDRGKSDHSLVFSHLGQPAADASPGICRVDIAEGFARLGVVVPRPKVTVAD